MEGKENVNLLFLLIFLVIPFSSAQSEIKTTSEGNSTTLILPAKDTIVVAAKSEISKPNFKWEFFLPENQKKYYHCSICDFGTQWRPILIISKEMIGTRTKMDIQIPKKGRNLAGRYLEASSETPVNWQVFTLPLEGYNVMSTKRHENKFVNISEAGTCVAVKKKSSTRTTISFQIHYDDGNYSETYDRRLGIGWSIICVNKQEIDEMKRVLPLRRTIQGGERLRVSAGGKLNFQVFRLPLGSGDINKEDDKEPDYKEVPLKDESAPTTTYIIISVIVISLVLLLLAVSHFGYRILLKKRNEARLEGTAPATMFAINNPTFENNEEKTNEIFGTVSRPEHPRPISSHDSENSLYGAVIHR